MTVYSNPSARFGSVSMVTATLGVNDPELGSRVIDSGKEYCFIYNAGNSQISVGQGCVLNTAATSYSMTVTSVVQTDTLFGVCHNATITTGTYGWVVTKGICAVMASAAVTIAPTEALILGANGYFTNIITSAAQATPYAKVVGKCIQTSASASTIGIGYVIGG